MNGRIVETGFRMDNGCYQQRFYPAWPSPEDANIAKAQAAKTGLQRGAVCVCCEVSSLVPTTIRYIIDTGICPFCFMVLQGKAEYRDLDGKKKISKSHCIFRQPTIEEIKKTWKGGALTSTESHVVMKALKEKT